jgi:hypothetical protein
MRSTTPIVADSRRNQLKRRGAMEQTNAEEVKIPAYSGEASLQVADGCGFSCRALQI